MEPIKLNDQKMPPSSDPDAEKREKPSPIVTGKVVKKKSRFLRAQKEISEIGGHILNEIVLPELKNMLYTTAQEAVGRSLFGDNYVHRGSPAPGRRTPYVSYSKPAVRAPERTVRSRRTHDFAEYILETRAEAESVIDALDERIRRYSSASVSDLNDLLGVTGSYTDVDWGWFNLRNADTRRVADGYILDLPTPEPIR